MALDCGKISASLSMAACGTSAIGVHPEVILMNLGDIESVTKENGIVTAIVLKDGAYAYKYETYQRAVEVSSPISKGTYITRFQHQVVFRAFTKTQEIKDQLNALANAKVVAIVKNVANDNDETKFEVYGLDNGLVMTDLQNASNDADGIVYAVTLSSDDTGLEGALPASFYTTSVEATQTAIDALLQNNG